MASGSHIKTGGQAGRHRALQAALALLLVSSAQIPTAEAASAERAHALAGCYRITVGDSSSELLVRLADVPVLRYFEPDQAASESMECRRHLCRDSPNPKHTNHHRPSGEIPQWQSQGFSSAPHTMT